MMGALSLFLVLLALALGVAWLSAWPILGLWRLVASAPGRERAARFNIVVLAVPFLLGAVVALGAIWPSDSLPWGSWACHCAPDAARSVHLCLTHPGASLPLLPLAAFLLVWLGWRPVRVVGSVVRSLLNARVLLDGAKGHQRDGAVRLVTLGTPNAFTVGLFRPVMLADQQWWASLTPTQRRIVAEHERAHAKFMDPLGYTIAQLLAGLAPQRVGRPLVVEWLTWAEHRADECSVWVIGDPATVADFIVQQARMGAGGPSLVPAFRGGDLEGRVIALLDVPAVPVRRSANMGLGFSLSATLAVLLLGLGGYQIHTLVESLLHLFP